LAQTDLTIDESIRTANLRGRLLAPTSMRDFIIFGGFIAAWVLLQAWLLPRLGVKT